MGSAVQLVDLHCFAEAARLVDSQCFVEVAGLVGLAVAVERLLAEQNWFLQPL
jgi:TATA-binding protein-associated factor Taf7